MSLRGEGLPVGERDAVRVQVMADAYSIVEERDLVIDSVERAWSVRDDRSTYGAADVHILMVALQTTWTVEVDGSAW